MKLNHFQIFVALSTILALALADGDHAHAHVGPVIHGPGPIIAGPGPIFHGPGPILAGPGPIFHGPGPILAGPGPIFHGPGPIVHRPVLAGPVIHAPRPVFVPAPAPVSVHSAPVPAPAPIYKPAPVYAPAPAPVYAPKPVYEEPVGPAVYNFGYGVQDDYAGLNFGHTEGRDGYKTQGTYYVNLPDGRLQTVNYHADEAGYVADVQYSGSAVVPIVKPAYAPK